MYGEEQHFDPPGPVEWEEVPGTDISPTAAALAIVGYYVGRALLVLGLVCFVVVGCLLAAGGVP